MTFVVELNTSRGFQTTTGFFHCQFPANPIYSFLKTSLFLKEIVVSYILGLALVVQRVSVLVGAQLPLTFLKQSLKHFYIKSLLFNFYTLPIYKGNIFIVLFL